MTMGVVLTPDVGIPRVNCSIKMEVRFVRPQNVLHVVKLLPKEPFSELSSFFEVVWLQLMADGNAVLPVLQLYPEDAMDAGLRDVS